VNIMPVKDVKVNLRSVIEWMDMYKVPKRDRHDQVMNILNIDKKYDRDYWDKHLDQAVCGLIGVQGYFDRKGWVPNKPIKYSALINTLKVRISELAYIFNLPYYYSLDSIIKELRERYGKR